MNSSKQLEKDEIRALAMIVVGRCVADGEVAPVAQTVLEQYLESIGIFEAYNQQIANKKYENEGIVL